MRFKKTAAFLGATALVILGGPAVAGPNHTVAVGGNSSGTVYNVTGTSKGAVTFVVNGVNMGCTGATAAGTIDSGALTAPVAPDTLGEDVAVLATTTWTGCIGPGGLAMTVTQSSAWCLYLNPYSQASTAPLTNVFNGVIKNCNGTAVMANVKDTATNGAICNFNVQGRAVGSFNEAAKANGTQDLTVAEPGTNLTVSGVAGCLGAITNGNGASFNGVYNVDTNGPGNRDINIF
ncbi:hypothetical protein [Mumia sp. ZJ430]|uniref:hypothetical protein n=1 Tax=Mumia sp. ZJ430 TaxID=2708083 RepID=UPI00142054EA|nr:hypothetical protein [Mumia sp. ZJ430]